MLHTANLPLTLAKVSLRQVCPAYRSNTPKERNLYHGICSSERWTAIDADRAAWESDCRMLKSGMAKVVKKCPFTIQLQYESERNVQPVSLGVDAGSKHIGISATTKTKVLYESDVELRDDIVKLLATRRQLRLSRRSRKTRYRPVRFDNRKRKEGWLAPSIRQKIGSHLTVVANVCKILPINQIIVETASFDIQKIKDQRFKGLNISRESRWTFGIFGSMYYSGTDTPVSVVREDPKTRY